MLNNAGRILFLIEIDVLGVVSHEKARDKRKA